MSESRQEENTAASGESSTVLRPERPSQAGHSVTPSFTEASGTALAPGRVLAGRYTVLDLLGQGGMGLVLAAYDARLDRRVALKRVHSRADARDGEGLAQVRMVREAQSMARLNHPHVVAIYDAGTLEDGSVFIAMEYVRGQTLREWCQRTPPRPWREVIEAYLAAGRGLAAAHAAGLVHRDFKPDNVLVGEDGRVRVTDFGLARVEASPDGAPPPAGALASPVLTAPLTLTGSVLGTPEYMAPELLQGQTANVRSDVYSFCAALHEALHGRLPGAPTSLDSALRQLQEGKPPGPPADSPVPAWVSRTVMWGLDPDPSRRPDSLEQVLRRLEDDPEARRQARVRLGGLVASVALLAGLGVGAWERSRGPDCAGLERRLEGIWDAPVKARVTQALQGTGLPYAEDTARRVERLLDGYAQAWVRQRIEVCQWEEPRGTAARPQGLALLREGCLEQRRGQLRALTELLARGPDPALVNEAVRVVQALPSLEPCADAPALLSAVPPPEDPQVRARVEALGTRVDSLAVLLSAGKYGEGLALSERLRPEVEALGHAPLEARVLLLEARLLEGQGDYTGSEAMVRRALAAAARGGDALRAAQASSLQLLLVGPRQARPQEAALLEPLVETLVELAHDDGTRADTFQVRGQLLEGMGRYAEARKHYERALALRERLFGAGSVQVALTLTSLGNVLRSLGRYPEARERLERALVLEQEGVGPTHVMVAQSLTTLGHLLREMGQYAPARAHYERALGILEGALGPEHLQTAMLRRHLGNLLMDLGRFEEARVQHEHCLAVVVKGLGPDHPEVARALTSVGITLAGQGRYEDARERFERARALHEKRLGPEHPEVAGVRINLGGVLADLGLYDEARASLERALAVLEKAMGPQHPVLAIPHTLLGRTLAGLGRYEDARRHLERALALQGQAQEQARLAEPLAGMGFLELARGRPAAAVPWLERALKLSPERAGTEIRFMLARALWDSKRDRSRARTLAADAREEWRRQGHGPRGDEVSRWLEARR